VWNHAGRNLSGHFPKKAFGPISGHRLPKPLPDHDAHPTGKPRDRQDNKVKQGSLDPAPVLFDRLNVVAFFYEQEWIWGHKGPTCTALTPLSERDPSLSAWRESFAHLWFSFVS